MRPPNGAADPVKPSHELLGEVLLQAGKPADAAAAFDASLLRMPNRARSLMGAARAYAAAGTQGAWPPSGMPRSTASGRANRSALALPTADS